MYFLITLSLPCRPTVLMQYPSDQNSPPQLFLHLWTRAKDFSRRPALDSLHDLLRTVHRHTLHHKMHRVFVSAYFQEDDLVALADLYTDLPQLAINCRN